MRWRRTSEAPRAPDVVAAAAGNDRVTRRNSETSLERAVFQPVARRQGVVLLLLERTNFLMMPARQQVRQFLSAFDEFP